jgi:hypothetical protein
MIMSNSPEFHFAWLNIYVAAISLVQVLLMGYRWRARTSLRRFTSFGVVLLALVWGAVFFVPFQSRATIEMPKAGTAPSVDAIVGTMTTLLLSCLVVGVNQLVLIGARRLAKRR